ncbi:hypothetical protein, partial [Burkholderia cenocepacia]|uniref:hypothetical protein n=1 Tax=Burkholderia cenocepacia TaxID=95486 RepID=UPI001955386F
PARNPQAPAGWPARRGARPAGMPVRRRKIVSGSGNCRGVDRDKWYLCRSGRREKGAGELIRADVPLWKLTAAKAVGYWLIRPFGRTSCVARRGAVGGATTQIREDP